MGLERFAAGGGFNLSLLPIDTILPSGFFTFSGPEWEEFPSYTIRGLFLLWSLLELKNHMNQFLKCINLILTLQATVFFCFATFTPGLCLYVFSRYWYIVHGWKLLFLFYKLLNMLFYMHFYSYTLLKDFQPGQKLLKLKKVHQHHIKTNDIRMGCHLSSYMCEASTFSNIVHLSWGLSQSCYVCWLISEITVITHSFRLS